MPNEKILFIQDEMFIALNKLTLESESKWGKMNAQQMIEHVIAFFNVSTEKLIFNLVTPEEQLPRYKKFLLSDKEFRENTKAPETVLGEEPLPVHYTTLSIAKEKLKLAVEDFVKYFKNDPEKKTLHPVFGLLNFEEWVLLHYKHVVHHLKQFNLI